MEKLKAIFKKKVSDYVNLSSPSFSFIMISGLTLLSTILLSNWDFIHSNHEQIRNTGLVCTALIGFPILIWRTRIADRQAATGEASHTAETYTKAIEQLGATIDSGAPHIELRLGGLYSLEKIAQNNKDYHNQIMEVLCAYVRMHAPMPEIITSSQEFNERIQTGELELNEKDSAPRIDLQAAMTIIGRRKVEHDARFFTLNLQSVNLRNFDLLGANLSRANLSDSDLSDSYLYQANLSMAVLLSANLQNAQLGRSNFSNAQLRDVNLTQAALSSADFTGANLVRSTLTDADMIDAVLVSANLRDASLIEASLEGANLEGANLNKANLTEASLSTANLIDTNLRRANLTGTDFSSAKTGNTNLEASKLINSVFQSVRIDIDKTLLLGAQIDDIMPSEAHYQLKEVQSRQAVDWNAKNSKFGPKIKI